MTPLRIIALLFWTMGFAGALVLITDRRLRAMLRSHWKMLALLLVLTALWRIPSEGVFFHGLEYEDSYVYTVAGRQLAERVGPSGPETVMPFSISTCAVGSIRNCSSWEVFPQHFLGLPYVIGVFTSLFGYMPSAGSFINLMASLLSVLLIFSITLHITGDSFSGVAAGTIFAITPVFAVYGLETSAEPFSNFCILLAVWFYLRLSDQMTILDWAYMWLAYTSTLLFAETVKRENILLAIVLPMMFALVIAKGRLLTKAHSIPFILIALSSVLALLLGLKMHIFQTSEGERELLRQFPFTAQRIVSFVSGFLDSFLVTRWYEGTVILVAIGVAAPFLKRRRTMLPIVMLAAYVLLYATHIRSYYEMASGQISPMSALRFSMNFMGLWSITAGLGAGLIVERVKTINTLQTHRNILKWCGILGSICALAICFLATRRLKSDATKDEAANRVLPATNAVHIADERADVPSYIVTMDPLVVQMYSGPDERIVDLESASVETLNALASTNQLIFLKETGRFSEADLNRYGAPVRYMLSAPSEIVMNGNGYQIDRIGSPNLK